MKNSIKKIIATATVLAALATPAATTQAATSRVIDYTQTNGIAQAISTNESHDFIKVQVFKQNAAGDYSRIKGGYDYKPMQRGKAIRLTPKTFNGGWYLVKWIVYSNGKAVLKDSQVYDFGR